ncbi:MAG: hypothetical protein MRY83_02365, partial [Flavobacteriales bacterium]|nr:hypothetical protein [Flavobacteriales bacterium]
MIRNFILAVISMVFFAHAYGQEPIITVETSENADPGQTFPVKIVIDKGAIVGFSMVKQNIPMGATAKLIDAQNASFSVQENKIKFIWIAVPQQEKITISYELTLPDTISSDFELKGLFYYLVEGKRTKVPITPITVKVNGALAMNDKDKSTEAEEKAKAEEEAKLKAEAEAEAKAKEEELAKAKEAEEKAKAEEEAKLKAEAEAKAKEEELAKAKEAEEKAKAEEEAKLKAEAEAEAKA